MNNKRQISTLEDFVPLSFFSVPKTTSLKRGTVKSCTHLGYLVCDGFNQTKSGKIQRVKCSRCKKRFGNGIKIRQLFEYQSSLKKVIYDIFFAKMEQKEVQKRYGIPQPQVSAFKKDYVKCIIKQHPDLFKTSHKMLPNGIINADETFIGKMGNSNIEIVVINNDFQILATGPAMEGDLLTSIQEAFGKIPASIMKKMKILITDGEPSYNTIAKDAKNGVIHVQQFHGKKKLGQIVLNRYKSFGPHTLHYEIMTHWKIFKNMNKEIKFKWAIRFIQGRYQAKRGRPTRTQNTSPALRQWRQKKSQYYNKAFKKKGSATVFLNGKNNKASLRAGAQQWMIDMIQPLIPIFKDKCVTNNPVESKHSQVKRKGRIRKQKDRQYGDEMFQISAYIAEHGHLPSVMLAGRPLFKYLTTPKKKEKEEYRIAENGTIMVQSVLSSYIE
jgi:hypothetical protein